MGFQFKCQLWLIGSRCGEKNIEVSEVTFGLSIKECSYSYVMRFLSTALSSSNLLGLKILLRSFLLSK